MKQLCNEMLNIVNSVMHERAFLFARILLLYLILYGMKVLIAIIMHIYQKGNLRTLIWGNFHN